MKQLLGLVQPGDWFTTIDLKNAYFHGEIAPRAQKVFAFCLPGGSLRVQQMPFGYSLSPRTFSHDAATAAGPWHEGRPHSYGQVQGMGNTAHSPIYPTPNQVGLKKKLRSIGRRAPPYLTSR